MAATTRPAPPSAEEGHDPLPEVRTAVRELLVSTRGFQELDPEQRRQVAQGMVRICHAAAMLQREEAAGAAPPAPPARTALATAQSAAAGFGAYADLINNVSASVEGFADANMGGDSARSWLVEHFPDAFELNTDQNDEGHPLVTVVLKSGGAMPSEAALRTALGLAADESPPGG